MTTKRTRTAPELRDSFGDELDAQAFARFVSRVVGVPAGVRPLEGGGGNYFRVVIDGSAAALRRAEDLRAGWDAQRTHANAVTVANNRHFASDEDVARWRARYESEGMWREQRAILEDARVDGGAERWAYAPEAVATFLRLGWLAAVAGTTGRIETTPAGVRALEVCPDLG